MVVHELGVWDDDHRFPHLQASQYRPGPGMADDQVARSKDLVDVADVWRGFDRDARRMDIRVDDLGRAILYDHVRVSE